MDLGINLGLSPVSFSNYGSGETNFEGRFYHCFTHLERNIIGSLLQQAIVRFDRSGK